MDGRTIVIIISIAIGVAIVNYVESGNSVNDFRNILEKATDDEEFKELYTDYVYGDWQYPEGAILKESGGFVDRYAITRK